MVTQFIRQVGEFHVAFDVARQLPKVNKSTYALRYDLFKEEYEEYLEGHEAKKQGLEYFTTKKGENVHTLTYLVDAICDMLYIASGTIDVFGWKLNFKRSKGYYSEEFILERIYRVLLITQERASEINYEIILNYILDLAEINGVYKILPKLFDEVHKSNMSKLGNDGKPIINETDSIYFDESKPLGKVLKGPHFFEPQLKPILEHYKVC